MNEETTYNMLPTKCSAPVKACNAHKCCKLLFLGFKTKQGQITLLSTRRRTDF